MALDHFEDNGHTYFRLCCRCPVCWDCGRITKHSFWTHYDDDCHGDIYVGDDAYFRCKKCGWSARVVDCGYACPAHSNSLGSFVRSRPAAIGPPAEFARIVGSSLVVEAGFVWVQKFYENLAVQL